VVFIFIFIFVFVFVFVSRSVNASSLLLKLCSDASVKDKDVEEVVVVVVEAIAVAVVSFPLFCRVYDTLLVVDVEVVDTTCRRGLLVALVFPRANCRSILCESVVLLNFTTEVCSSSPNTSRFSLQSAVPCCTLPLTRSQIHATRHDKSISLL